MKLCNCLVDRIAISPQCSAVDNCAYYIDDLPGITRSKFESLTSEDRTTYLEIFNKVEKRALQSVYSDMNAKLAQAFKTRVVIDNVETAEWYKPHTTLALENKYNGYELDLRGSNYVSFFIDFAEFYVYNDISPSTEVVLNIVDLDYGVLLGQYTETYTGAAFYRFNINEEFFAKRIFIFYEAFTYQSYETVSKSTSYYDELCMSCTCSTHGRCAYIDSTDGISHENIKYSTAAGCGMIVKYKINCSTEAWICEHSKQVLPMLYYKMGAEFFIELIASDRINAATLISQEKLEALLSYLHSNYSQLLSAFDKNIQQDDKTCFECKDKITKARIRI